MINELKCNDFEKKRFLYTFLSAMAIGLIAHLFGMVNIVQSNDSINAVNGYGSGLFIGRWFLQILGDIQDKLIGNRNLQFLNNFISLVLLSISSYVIIRIFNIKKISNCIIWSGIFVSFPFVTSLFLFAFTSVYYCIAILLTVLAVYYTDRNKYGILIATILSTLALGIYQAFFPMMVTMYLLLLLVDLLNNKEEIKNIVFKGLKYLGILVVSLILYFVVLKLILLITHTQLGHYKGMDEMGKLNIKDIPMLLIETYYFYFKTLILTLSYKFPLKLVIIVLGLFVVIGTYFIIFRNKNNKISSIILTTIIFILLPIALDLVVIMTKGIGGVSHLMIYSFALTFLMPILITENNNFNNNVKAILNKIVIILTTFVICNYIYQSNLNYTMNYYAEKEAENFYNNLISRVYNTEGYTEDKEIIFIGELTDSKVKENVWWENSIQTYNDAILPGKSKLVSLLFTRKFIPYSANDEPYIRINNGRNNKFINQILGYNINVANKDIVDLYKDNEDVKTMNVYPNYNSIKKIDKYIVIKLSN